MRDGSLGIECVAALRAAAIVATEAVCMCCPKNRKTTGRALPVVSEV
jgi:hypothetical protein